MFQASILNKRPILNNGRTIVFWLGLAAGIPFIFYLFFVLAANSWNIITALITVLQNDILILLTIGVCFGIIYYTLNAPSKRVTLEIDDELETVRIDSNTAELSNLVAWSVVELGDCFEFVIRFQDSRAPYQYFYITKNDENLQKTLSYFSNNFVYDEGINTADRMHTFFRLIGVK